MDEEESLNPTSITDDTPSRKPTAYDLLMRQSRKMGGLATRTYDVTKEFLKQDVSTLHPDRILFGSSAFRQLRDKRKDKDVGTQSNDTSQVVPGSVEARASEGIREADERDAKTLDPRESLRHIVKKSHQILAGAQTVILPMNLFPDTVVVDRTKVTITKRTFFWTASVISIRIEDVLNVACSTGPIFGSLIISSRVMNSTDHYEIDYFWRKDALYLKQIIQGYVIAQHNRIETSHLERKDLINTLLELGSDSAF
jgi:hypothetical protein